MANAAAKHGPSLGMRNVGAYRKFVDLLNIHEVSPEPPKASKAPKVETPHRTVRRQIIWDRCERDLAECWPHLVDRS